MINNNGGVLVRAGNLDNSSLILYKSNLQTPEPIASPVSFLKLGGSPGMSDDGKVIAFFGEISPDRAFYFTRQNRNVVPIPVTPGRGIFANIEINGIRHIVRVAGEVGSDHLDPGELRPLDTLRDRGQDFDFNDRYSSASDWEIKAFVPDESVAVSSLTAFGTQSKGSYVTVFYTATNSVGAAPRRAIFSSRINLFNNAAGTAVESVGVEAPIIVAQTGDLLLAQVGQLRSLGDVAQNATSDAIAFGCECSFAQAIVLAERARYRSFPTDAREAYRIWTTSEPNSHLVEFDADSPIVEYIVPAWYSAGRAGVGISQIVLHATGSGERSAVDEFGHDDQATTQSGEVINPLSASVHYVISRDGRVTQMVPEELRANHAVGANPHSVGIELVDDNHSQAGVWVTETQKRKVALLVRDICVRRGIQATHLTNRVQGLFYPLNPFELPVAYSRGNGSPECTDGLARLDADGSVLRGVIGHGHILNRLACKTDPENFPWPAFMTMVNQGIGLTLNSPANLLVTDPMGRRTGYDAGNGQMLLEIPGSQFSGAGTEPQSLSIPDATNGNYTIKVIGASNGVFHLDILASGLDAGLTQTRVAGSTSLGAVTTYTLNHDAVIGDATKVFGASNLPPVAFNDFAQTTTNVAVAVNVLANDNDPDAFLNTNSVTIVTNASNGTLSVNPTNGIIIYTPTNGFEGTNTFTYTVQDNQGALSNPGTVTVVVTEPIITSNAPPVALNDFASTTNGSPVTIDVLANDFAPDGTLDSSTVALTRAPTNGTASVDSFTGAITYTPNPGTTNRDSFRYTVQDDLGTTSNEGLVTVTNIVLNGGGGRLITPIPDYLVLPVTSGAVDHRYPRINNLGEVVYQSPVSGLQQIWKKPPGDPTVNNSESQITFSNANYSDATSPALADDGSYVSFRNRPGSPYPCIVLYPAQTAIGCSAPGGGFYPGFTEVGPRPSLSSDGKVIWFWAHQDDGSSAPPPTRQLLVTDRGSVAGGGYANGNWPDLNSSGNFTYETSGQIYLNNAPVLAGQLPNIGDAPRDNPDIVYVSGTNLMSTLFGRLDAGPFSPIPIGGSWVDVNSNGVLVFEKFVNGYYQVYKAYPWEARIVSRGGTNGLVGLPYKYDGDNVTEAYGGPEPVNDPREYFPLEWSLVSGPPGFTIDPDSGHINWIPSAPGQYTVVIRVWTTDPYMNVTEDIETINVKVAQSTMQVVDAMDYRTPGMPDLPTVATNYIAGGTPRIGVLADGASRLVLRVPLVGAETNSFPNLHFGIGGTSVSRDGFLRAISGSAWTNHVPVTIANVNGTNMALCLYESPMDFDAASQPVTLRLYNGTSVIATQAIQLRRPPVVLVHDGWSGPDSWPVLISGLFDAGMDVYLVDYEYAAGNSLSASDTKIFLKGNEAIALARQSGFAASRFDLIGHGSGGILARLHAQRYAAQDTNYRKGDVHKLITVGTPHQGSWLASAVLALRTNTPTVFASLSNAVLLASEAAGYFPPINLNAGLLDDLAPGSTNLMQLEATTVPSHAIAATINTLPPGDPIAFIHYFLGLTNQGDGLVTTNSSIGGIQTNASTVFTNIAHAFEPTDPNVVARVLTLLQEPVSGSIHFGFFPTADAPTNVLAGFVVTNIGTWLSLSGATNGQTFTPGQTVSVTAIAGGGHVLQSVQFISPVGSALVTTRSFSFNFQIPTQAVGRVVIAAAGRDTNNEVAFASVALNIAPAFALQSLVVEPSPVVFNVKADLPLRVWGLYADGIQRDLTLAASGTKYGSSDTFNLVVLSNGVLHLRGFGFPSPVTVSITNGVISTNVQVTMSLTNLPPTAVITADRISGPAPFDVQFNGAGSADANGDALNYLWDFGDGTTSGQQTPPLHRFWAPGEHVVTLTIADPLRLIGITRQTISVEARLYYARFSLLLEFLGTVGNSK